MKTWISDQKKVKSQYSQADNLRKRIQIHRYSTNPQGWVPFILSIIHLNESDTVLEIGCGTADLWKHLISNGVKVSRLVLSDLSSGMLEKAKESMGDEAPFTVGFEQFDAAAIPFPENCFDVVIANHVLYHVGRIESAVEEIARVLKPGGRFYGTTVGKRHMIELAELARKIVPEIPFPSTSVAEMFGMENGAELLSKHLRNVEKHEYEDHLEIPGPDPLLDYIVSVDNKGVLDSDKAKAELRKRVEDEVDFSEAFRITKKSGIFAAEKLGKRRVDTQDVFRPWGKVR